MHTAPQNPQQATQVRAMSRSNNMDRRDYERLDSFDEKREDLVAAQESLDCLRKADLENSYSYQGALTAQIALMRPPMDPLSLTAADKSRRRLLKALANGSLVQEFLFLFFQYWSTCNGLIDLGVEQNTARVIAAPLSFADWMVNVLSISVPSDADGVLFTDKDDFSRSWTLLWGVIKTVSLVGSYPFGGAADALPLMALVPQDLPHGALAAINYSLIIANIIPATNYYRLFNHQNIFDHLVAFRELLRQPQLFFKRVYHKPINALRYMELLRNWVAVVGYRSISFAFIAQAVAPYVSSPLGLTTENQDIVSNSLALMALGTTALNVVFGRLLPSYKKIALVDFDVITLDEYQNAVKALWQNAGQAMLALSGAAVPNIVSAAGWTILTHSLFDKSWSPAAMVGAFTFFNSSYIEYQAKVYRGALDTLLSSKDSNEAEVKERLNGLYAIPLLPNEVIDNDADDLPTRVSNNAKVFSKLRDTFEDHSRWLNVTLATLNFGARTARIIGFYGFVKVLANTFSDYSGAAVSDIETLALCCILAPENFKNELGVFGKNMKEVIQGWQAKHYLEQQRLKRPPSYWETIKLCLNKSEHEFSTAQIKEAVARRRPDAVASVGWVAQVAPVESIVTATSTIDPVIVPVGIPHASSVVAPSPSCVLM